MINIWLDDVRPAPDGWIWAKDVGSCFYFLEEHQDQVGIMSLDHDLGTRTTGYDLAKLLCENPMLFPKEIYLHTSNPVGRTNMFQLLRRFIDVNDIESRVYAGPHIWSWEQSVAKSKELGYF